ncbi:MAG: Ppx/GppA phosphatase family protein [Gammaproteobacteria bacterium]|jgi:exopolyphosphatase/guanosine-5'-triphosphate,3'-diphosphate pyrophosphatase|tara:strand:+ start:4224 stop:5078 length:855 start_codon:yes stop_codon:yes gene_type:complete
MKIASIDIGTNAIKSKIFSTTSASIKFVQGMRSPIRLGSEVFEQGQLSKKKLKQVIETIQGYEEIFKSKGIVHYDIIATSAFRDTSNSEEARRYIETAIHHPLRIISGLEEAKLIGFHPKANIGKTKLFVDLGGGSTEFYFRQNQKIEIRSFQLGAVRNMLKKDQAKEWRRLEAWLVSIKPVKKLTGIGGNIKSFLESQNVTSLKTEDFNERAALLSQLTTKKKILTYQFSPDRADVIDDALHIFKFIAETLGVEAITSTKWGVSDSIAVKLFHQLYSGDIKIL